MHVGSSLRTSGKQRMALEKNLTESFKIRFTNWKRLTFSWQGIVVTLLFLLAGCKSSNDATENLAALPPLPPDLSISCSSGGGFSGLWTGFTFEADQDVWQWQGMGNTYDSTLIGRIPPDTLYQLWQELQNMSFFELTQSQTGNMTTAIEARANERSNKVRWPTKVYSVEGMQSPTDSFYVHCSTLAERLSID